MVAVTTDGSDSEVETDRGFSPIAVDKKVVYRKILVIQHRSIPTKKKQTVVQYFTHLQTCTPKHCHLTHSNMSF